MCTGHGNYKERSATLIETLHKLMNDKVTTWQGLNEHYYYQYVIFTMIDQRKSFNKAKKAPSNMKIKCNSGKDQQDFNMYVVEIYTKDLIQNTVIALKSIGEGQ